MNRPLRIGLLGPYHSRNFGDTSIQMAVIANLRRNFPDLELVGICSDPPDTERTHGIPAFPLSGRGWDHGNWCLRVPQTADKRHRKSIFRRVQRKLGRIYDEKVGCFYNIAVCCHSLDMLLIAGSGQLDDFWGGPWKHPFSLLIWSLFSRLNGAKVAVFGIGWDDLSTRLGKFFSFNALRLAHYRSFRDNGTVQKLSASGVRLESQVCPDPAFGLETPSSMHADNTPAVIMVCPIGSHAWLGKADPSYAKYVEELVDSCEQWLREGYSVRLASSQTSMDTPLAQEIAARLRTIVGDTALLQSYDTKSVQHYLQLARNADLVVASRLHALILAAVAETPLVAVSPTRKASQLMADLDLRDYCLELPKLRAEELMTVVSCALQNRKELRNNLLGKLAQYRKELDIQYRNIKELLDGSH